MTFQVFGAAFQHKLNIRNKYTIHHFVDWSERASITQRETPSQHKVFVGCVAHYFAEVAISPVKQLTHLIFHNYVTNLFLYGSVDISSTL